MQEGSGAQQYARSFGKEMEFHVRGELTASSMIPAALILVCGQLAYGDAEAQGRISMVQHITDAACLLCVQDLCELAGRS